MNVRQHNVQQLGEKFVAGLEATLTPAKIRAVAAMNECYRLAGDYSACATYDFCDATSLMLTSFMDQFPGVNFNDISTSDFQTQLWADGWEAAKAIIRDKYLHATDTMPEGLVFIQSVEWEGKTTSDLLSAEQFLPSLLSRPPWTTFEYAE